MNRKTLSRLNALVNLYRSPDGLRYYEVAEMTNLLIMFWDEKK